MAARTINSSNGVAKRPLSRKVVAVAITVVLVLAVGVFGLVGRGKVVHQSTQQQAAESQKALEAASKLRAEQVKNPPATTDQASK